MNSMNLSHLLPYQTRSICPENRTGGKGMGGGAHRLRKTRLRQLRGIWATAGRSILIFISNPAKC